MNITCEQVPYGGEWYLKALVVRHAVLRAPLQLCYTPEELAQDPEFLHFVAREGGQVAANISLAEHPESTAQIKQVAVAEAYQGRGVGSQLMRHVEAHARKAGVTRIFLNARQPTVPFYEKNGYRPEGAPFELLGLPHQRMVKTL